ncbi:cell envelope integrity protein TolA [Enterobacter hormaechei]|uniref:cell envelope integrity protein TolA n=1 Tax=Enterobacteriaceae TaxID=543 RepID=UPI000981E0CB|nr:cell envelope integrity protein TolA [Leclercia adecarboxylata]MCE9981291.1 cell envelope integrity protein TolA [Leclercia adecarboxylata]MDU1985362.1 cell envelope integrity protein TolA [Streptococcus parasanguinis]OOB84472.1 protein TolA [Leclercia adecarboxylata]
MKFIPLLLVAVMLAGCAPHAKHSAPVQHPKITSAVTAYAQEVRSVISSKLDKPDAYSGKTCTLRVNLNRDAVLDSVQAEGGDPALCEAAIAAIKTSTFPPFTDETYQVFHNVVMDFKL